MHRDIKPSNILIRREDEQPVLIDFGAAKQEFALQSKSVAPYSPGYAAIEQVSEGRLGAWTDLYGVGAVMWRMVAGGKRPHEPPQPVKVERRLHAKFRGEPDPMPSARELGKERFSERVLGAIDRCLELGEQDRLQDCGELLRRMRGDGKTGSDLSSPKPPIREGRWTFGDMAAGVVFAMLLVLFGVLLWVSDDQPKTDSTRLGRYLSETPQPVDDQLKDDLDIAPSTPVQRPRDRMLTVDEVEALLFPQGIPEKSRTSGKPSSEDDQPREDSSGTGVPVGPAQGPARVEEKSAPVTSPFTVEVKPADAKVELPLLNSQMGYRRGMALVQGKHLVEVSAPGYETRRVTVEHDGRGPYRIELQRSPMGTPYLTLLQGPTTFTRGSHKDDVLRIQGTPSSIKRYPSLNHEVWWYGSSMVDISLTDGRVTEWSNRGNLKVRLDAGPNVTGTRTFTRGSHKDDVLRIQGTPSSIKRYPSLNHEVWWYGSSMVDISLTDGRVTEWSNRGNLKVRLDAGPNVTGTRTFTRGSHKDDVLRIQGTPSSIKRYPSLNHEVWWYGSSMVDISLTDGRVTEWSNRGNLKVRLDAGPNVTGTRTFTRGSHKDDVLRIQGTPSSIKRYPSLNHEVWWYGSSMVDISLTDGRVTEWSNRGNLKVRMDAGPN